MGRLKLDQSGPWISVAGLALLLWLCAASVLFAPWWGIVVFALLWVCAALLALAMVRPYPRGSIWVPAVAALMWFAIAFAGGRWFGWSA